MQGPSPWLVLFLMLLKTASWQYSFCVFEFTQKTQLGQKCSDNMIFSLLLDGKLNILT